MQRLVLKSAVKMGEGGAHGLRAQAQRSKSKTVQRSTSKILASQIERHSIYNFTILSKRN